MLLIAVLVPVALAILIYGTVLARAAVAAKAWPTKEALALGAVVNFFDTFGIIHNVTQGGPAKATEILVYKVWYDGMVGLDLGSSAAQSVILMAIVIGLTAIQFRFIERRVHYA